MHVFMRDIYSQGLRYTGLLSEDYIDLTDENVKRTRDKTKGYLWPEGFNEKTEKRLRLRLTPRRFASQYLNQIVSVEDGGILDITTIRWIHQNQIEVLPNMVRIHDKADDKELPTEVRPILFVDPAASLNDTADYTVIGVGGVGPDGRLYILDVRMGRWLTSQTISKVFELVDKWMLRSVTVEAVGFQVALVNSLKEAIRNEGRRLGVVNYKLKGYMMMDQTALRA